MRRLISLILVILMCLSSAAAEWEFYDRFPGKFLEKGAEPVITETSYQSDSIYFTVTSMRVHDSDVYVIDIYIASVENLQRYYGGGEWGRAKSKAKAAVKDIAKDLIKLAVGGVTVSPGVCQLAGDVSLICPFLHQLGPVAKVDGGHAVGGLEM